MQNDKLPFYSEFCSKRLNIINGVRFTPKEIDIISCILSGRSAKTIPFFLSISPKTVDTHLGNIRTKAGCNSRESIIDFVEKSDKFLAIKEHYLILLTQIEFEKSLKVISQLNQKKNCRCLIVSWEEENSIDLASILQRHLKIAGLTVSAKSQKGLISPLERNAAQPKEDYIIYVLSKTTFEKLRSVEKPLIKDFEKKFQVSQKVFFLVPEIENSQDNSKEIKSLFPLNIIVEKNYYFLVLEVLKKILPDLDLEKIILDFKEKYENIEQGIHRSSSLEEKQVESTSQQAVKPIVIEFLSERKWYLVAAIFLMIFSGIGLLTIIGVQDQKGTNKKNYIEANGSIRSDLILPARAVLLDRPELMTKINEYLQEQDDIQTVALVGIGGSGKTTLARSYARSQSASLIWEFNAETMKTLTSSFEDLAHTLSKTEEDKKNLRDLQDIKNLEKRENKILQFVKERLKVYSNWFLIYDNVEKFTDIQNYFPQDSGTWGQGKVIVTTRNSNFQNNKHIPLTNEEVIEV